MDEVEISKREHHIDVRIDEQCLHDKISCVLMVYGGVKNTCGNGQFCIDIRPYFTLKTIYCAVVRLVCNVHLYSVVLSNGQKILFSYRVDKALDVANLKSSAEPKQPLRVLKYRQGIASELLTRCKYFEVYRMIVNTERRQKVHYRADEIAFRVLLCVNGCGTISYEDGNLPFYKGDCIFVPADSEVLTIHGQAQFLDVRG